MDITLKEKILKEKILKEKIQKFNIALTNKDYTQSSVLLYEILDGKISKNREKISKLLDKENTTIYNINNSSDADNSVASVEFDNATNTLTVTDNEGETYEVAIPDDFITEIREDGVADDTKAPTEKAVRTELDKKIDLEDIETTVRDTATASDDKLVTEKAVRTELDTKEDSFDKNTAFNKDFGTGATDVATGDHNHDNDYEPKNDNIQNHISDTTTNPHNVTSEQVGLGNVDNTSDADKPISDATQTALDDKVDKVVGKELSTNDLTDELKDRILSDRVISVSSDNVNHTITFGFKDSADITVDLSALAVDIHVNGLSLVGETLHLTDTDGNDMTLDLSQFVTADELNTALDTKEDKFDKNTAFNKNFGTGSDEVATGDHTHDDLYYTESEIDTKLDDKVDKVAGKELSSNDYTDAEKTKLADLDPALQHEHDNKTVIDKFGEDASGNPTYNGNPIDTTIAQRDVYDGLDSTDNTISLSAKQGKVLDDKITTEKDRAIAEENTLTKTDGSRAFTGTVSGIDPTAPTHLTTKQYVDDGLNEKVDDNLYTADGTIESDRTVNLDTKNINFDNGKVGIGNSAPTYALDVVGDIQATNWVRTKGDQGLFFQDHGGGLRMIDDTWIRTYGSKHFYCDKIIRADGGFQVDGKTMISSTGGSHTARGTDDLHYGYFEARNNSNQRAFYLGYGNGSDYANFKLETGKLLLDGGLFDFEGDVKVGKKLFDATDNAGDKYDRITTDGATIHWSKNLFEGQWYNKVRYVRVEQHGSTSNGGNHIVEVHTRDLWGDRLPFVNLSDAKLSDGDIQTEHYTSVGTVETFDLGEVKELSSLSVWRYFKDDRTYYDTKVEVSEDGVNWVILADQEEPETYRGWQFVLAPMKDLTRYNTSRKYVYSNGTAKSFDNGNAVTLLTTPTYIVQPRKNIIIDYKLPLRSDSDSWGGAYINLNVNVDGTWYNLGNGGYDGNIMHYSARSISTWRNRVVLNIIDALDLDITKKHTVQVELTGRSYNTTVKLNSSHDLNRTANNLDSRGALATWGSNQNFSTIYVEEYDYQDLIG